MTNHVRRNSPLVLLLIDVINHFDFPDGEKLLRQALPIARPLVHLALRARAAEVPVIYVNDNFGQWRSDASRLIQSCLKEGCPGKRFVEIIAPQPDDYFVLKPMHSAFFQTPLDLLLRHFGASSLMLAGLATNSCVLCASHDANMRGFEVTVISDCCAARTTREHRLALEHIESMADARIVQSSNLRLPSKKSRR